MCGEVRKNTAVRVVVVTGPVGSGKSTVSEALSDELEARGVRHALVSMDHLRWVYPRAEGERFGARLGLANLAAIWPNLKAEGVRWVILADVVEHPNEAAQYVEAMPGTDVTVVRLNVPMPLILKRLEARETSEESLEKHRHRAPELQGIMEREGVGDLMIDVDERSPVDVAREIAGRL